MLVQIAISVLNCRHFQNFPSILITEITDYISLDTFCVCCQVVILLGYWDEFLHGNCQAEGSQEVMGHAHSRELPAQTGQVSPPPHTLPDLRLVSH